MPNIRTSWETPKRQTRRYKVKATGEVGSSVSKNGLQTGDRLVALGSTNNIRVIDLCLDETGEIRTFRAEYLEELEPLED